ncbi:MAG: threonylcarbamoyl-AMP synthase [Tannerella sp.]|jgi:tRNA threonylcarbamoyl adenosine modification protein (Sua5/YciO/YrdC/YwlC family)|nr:threonylcarbamoyl-AMP synthase [Tannerella sp.]
MLTKIYPENPNPKEIDKVVNILQDSGLAIYPTDTMYAIGCDALNVRAVENICRIKQVNPSKSNLSIICYDLSSISEYAKVSNAVFKLIRDYLPGPFTFILPTSSGLPKIYKNRKEVGIRMPDNPIIMEICRRLGHPVMTMSVHYDEDEPEYSTDPELIHERYEEVVDIVIDGGIGDTEGSTVVDCTVEPFEIIRQGKGFIDLS